MFAFNPGNEDQSGRILGGAYANAAQTTADAQVKMVDDIGSALVGLAGAYGEMEGNKAKGRAFKDAFKVISPSAGIDMKQLEALTGTGLKNDMDWYNARETIAPLLPSMINAQLGQQRIGVQQAGQQLDRDRPFIDASLKNLGNTAAGRGTYGTPRGETTVEPDLPIGGDFLPPVRYGAGMQNNVTRFAPSQRSVSTARNWSAGYFGKSNP
jgi:hypothetical protein